MCIGVRRAGPTTCPHGGEPPMSLILGIDPGLDGALAVLDSRGSWTVHDTPTLTIKSARGSRRVYAVSSLTRLVTSAMSCDAPAVVRAAIELVHSSPQQGVRSAFSMGYGVGLWEGVLAGLGIPCDRVTPQRWKKTMLDGMGHDKDAGRARAQQIFPMLDLSLKRHHGRADALLIAEWLRRTVAGRAGLAEPGAGRVMRSSTRRSRSRRDVRARTHPRGNVVRLPLRRHRALRVSLRDPRRAEC